MISFFGAQGIWRHTVDDVKSGRNDIMCWKLIDRCCTHVRGYLEKRISSRSIWKLNWDFSLSLRETVLYIATYIIIRFNFKRASMLQAGLREKSRSRVLDASIIVSASDVR